MECTAGVGTSVVGGEEAWWLDLSLVVGRKELFCARAAQQGVDARLLFPMARGRGDAAAAVCVIAWRRVLLYADVAAHSELGETV